MSGVRWGVGLALWGLLCAGPALAQPKEQAAGSAPAAEAGAAPAKGASSGESGTVSGSAERDTELAKQYYKLGEQLYNRADYAGALKQFENSYRYSKAPALLFNIARCHEAMGDQAQAVSFLKRYLASDPPKADLIRKRIDNLEAAIAKKERDKAEAEARARREAEAKKKDTPAPVRSEGRTMRTAGWVLAAGGAAAMVGGVVLGIMAHNKARSLEEDAAALSRDYADAKADESAGRGLNTGAIIALGVGGAALVTGAVLLVLDYRKVSRERRAWLAPAVSPGGAMVSAGLSF